ncbi:MAG: A/G-specific adenine glycosylase [Porticoccaceae bacterium]|nr:A/G-specific adenine glycosylase [Porticoccaceae bacterium]
MQPHVFQRAVLDWFDRHGRTNLPWQQEINPYRVWVSEIMLQQTQVSTVIPYFERFITSFPDVETLASAPLDNVLHHWTGLGYYARARNLHKTAVLVSTQLKGQFPSSIDGLCELPGIGRSTAGAISSIAFKIPATILDGNVKRVLARFSATEGWPGRSEVVQKLWLVAETYTPEKRIADYTQAMMDLGATLCTRSSPNCEHCPLVSDCIAHREGNQTNYPGKKPKKKLPVRSAFFLLIQNPQGEILLQQNPPAGLWGGLWVMPQIESHNQLAEHCLTMGLKIIDHQILPAQRHTFSHFHLDYQPIRINASEDSSAVAEGRNQVWYNPQKPLSLGMPAPIKALLSNAQKQAT